MKTASSRLAASIATIALAALPVACSSYTSDGGEGGGSTGATSAAGGNSSVSDSSSSGGSGASSSSSSEGGSSTPTGGSSSSSSSSAPPVGGSSTPAGGSSASSSSRAGGSTTPLGGSSASVATSASSGGSSSVGGTTRVGGTTASGGSTGGTTASASSSSSTPNAIALPCDVFNKASGNKCVSAHSTVRVIVPDYTGPLYQLCKGTANAGPSSCKGTTQDVGSKDGYADVDSHNSYCPSSANCTITKIYDQSGQKNDLEPAPKGGAKGTPDNPAQANALPVKINGHNAYGILIKSGIGYRTGCTQCTIKQGNGMVKGDNPQTHYWVTSQKDLVDGCCFDYGNAETTSNDDGNGTMETLYFGGGVIWGTGSGGKPGPWMMADLENGLYAGWERKQDKDISTNKPLKFDFVDGYLLGDTKEKNNNKGRFALLGGDATGADATYGKTLGVMYDGIRPEKSGYVPMQKQGSIILGIGGDNSNAAGGRFYEGAVSAGPVITIDQCNELHTAIVAAKYGQ